MKRILTVLILAGVMLSGVLAGCGSPDDAAVVSGTSSSVSSHVSEESTASKPSQPLPVDDSSGDESGKEESKKEESSREPSQTQEDIDLRQWEEEDLGSIIPSTKSEVNDLRLTMYKDFAYNKNFGISYADIYVYGNSEELLKFINELCKREKENLYIEYFEFNVVESAYLYLDYDDEDFDRTRYYNVRLRLANPYLKGDMEEADACKYVKDHWNNIDRKKFFDALLKEHNHYYYTKLKGSLMPDKDKNVVAEASLDFATYNGFVTYKYKLGETGNFIPDENAAVKAREKSDIPLPYHADIKLTVKSFKK